MSSLRYILISDEPQPGDLGRSLGVILLCLLISAWIHLVGFVIWQNLDQGAADGFYFELADQPPVMELNLVMNEPPVAAEAQPAGGEPETAPLGPPPEPEALMTAEEAVELPPVDEVDEPF
ncbi:MAG: hypothetical protein LBP33_08075, partial [Candidatus Adiutrix sp.]|nr:hypothetical protein [Candidatus Adiutrix sp.]